MSRKFLRVNWRVIDGAAHKKKILRLRPNEDGLYMCPVGDCMHTGFRTSRGLRKHIDSRHSWFYFFENKPAVGRDQLVADPSKLRSKCYTRDIPSFSITDGIGADFRKWLRAPLGGGKNDREASQIARRGMKFLLHVVGEDFIVDRTIWSDYIDCAIGSASTVIKFMETVTQEWGISSSGALNYVKSIMDLADFRISQGVSDAVLRAFSATEVYLRRGKTNLQKKKVMEYSRNLDLESLILRDSWCTLEEMEKVIPFHAPRFKQVYDDCTSGSNSVSVNDLAFASRFIASYLFLRVKCTRPRTFQFLTLQMVDKARTNGGFVDQTEFKTMGKYLFDTIILTEEIFKVLDMYISAIRPRMQPKCNYVVISNTGNQYTSFTTAMTMLVKQAIGKYVHPTRLRQIVESTSNDRLTPAEQEAVTADQKHASYVAQRSYKKKLSRDVASKSKECMGKMLGPSRVESTCQLATILADSEKEVETIDERVLSKTCEILGAQSVSPEESNPALEVNDVPCITSTPDELVMTSRVEGSPGLPVQESDKQKLPTWPVTSQPIIDVKEENEQPSRTRLRKTTKKFTKSEDDALIAGVQKYGVGHWGKILQDSSFKFNDVRTRDSLRMRYGSAELQRTLKKKKD